MKIYQYIGPVIFTPLSYFLWKGFYGDHFLFWLAFLAPIIWAYILPGVGTNILNVWEFNVSLKLGNYRPHHGFVFGSITGVLTFLLHGHQCENLWDVFRFAVILGSFIGYWNTIYDIRMLKQGIVNIYNKPYADGLGPEAIVLDYAPMVFGFFGFFYALAIGTAELLIRSQPSLLESTMSKTVFFIIAELFMLVLPVAFFSIKSYLIHGDHGLYRHTKS